MKHSAEIAMHGTFQVIVQPLGRLAYDGRGMKTTIAGWVLFAATVERLSGTSQMKSCGHHRRPFGPSTYLQKGKDSTVTVIHSHPFVRQRNIWGQTALDVSTGSARNVLTKEIGKDLFSSEAKHRCSMLQCYSMLNQVSLLHLRRYCHLHLREAQGTGALLQVICLVLNTSIVADHLD